MFIECEDELESGITPYKHFLPPNGWQFYRIYSCPVDILGIIFGTLWKMSKVKKKYKPDGSFLRHQSSKGTLSFFTTPPRMHAVGGEKQLCVGVGVHDSDWFNL